MRRRIVVAGIAIAVVIGALGGTVAAFAGGHATPAHRPHASTPTTAVPQPTTPVTPITTTSTVPAPATTVPTPTVPTPTVATTPAPAVTTTTTTQPQPAIGGPAGSRYGPTGSPTPDAVGGADDDATATGHRCPGRFALRRFDSHLVVGGQRLVRG